MFGSTDYIGLAIQDDVIRVARLRVSGDDIKLVKLDQFSLVEDLKTASNEYENQEENESDPFADYEDENADDVFGLDEDEDQEEGELDLAELEGVEGEQSDDMALDMVDESDESQSNELQLYNILTDIDSEKIHVGLNVPAGHTIFQVIRDTDFKEIKKKDLIEDLENKLQSIYGEPKSSDNYSYEVREDGSLLLGSIEEESITLQVLNSARELYSGKLNIQSVIPDEIALVGLVRSNYELEPDEITCVIQFGKEQCRVVFMKGEEIWLVSPLINEGTNNKSFLNTVFSKILFQLDTGEVPSLNRILIANNTVGKSALDFFEENFSDIKVSNLSFEDGFLEAEHVDPSSLPSFSTAIGTALAASGAKSEAFPEISFIPKYVIDRQKIFQLQWHGLLILFLIFLTPITFNYFYNQNARQITNYSNELDQINAQIEQVEPTIEKVNDLEENLSILREKLTMLDTLAQGSEEWSEKLRILNNGIQQVGSTWITTFRPSNDDSFIEGYTLYRSRIPEIVNIFDEATLLSVNNEEMREETTVYTFTILVQGFAPSDSIYSPPTPQEVKNLIGS